MMISGGVSGKRTNLNLRLQGDLNDKSINKYNVSSFNNPSSSTGIFGQSNGSFDFNGTTQYLTLSSTVNQLISQDMNSNGTISFWIYADNITPLNGVMSSYNNTTQNSFNIQYTDFAGGDIFYSRFNGTNGNFYNKGQISNNKWYFITIVYIVNNVILYIDGDFISEDVYSEVCKEDSTNVVWVSRRGDGNYLNGKLSDIRENGYSMSHSTVKILNKQKGRIKA